MLRQLALSCAVLTALSIFRMIQSLYLKIHFAFLFRIRGRRRKVFTSKTKDLLLFILLHQVKLNSKTFKAINLLMTEENFVKLLNRKFWFEHRSTNLTKWWKRSMQILKWKLKTCQSLRRHFKNPKICCFNRNLRLKMKSASRIKLLKMKLCTKKIHKDTLTERSSSNSTFEWRRDSKILAQAIT